MKQDGMCSQSSRPQHRGEDEEEYEMIYEYLLEILKKKIYNKRQFSCDLSFLIGHFTH